MATTSIAVSGSVAWPVDRTCASACAPSARGSTRSRSSFAHAWKAGLPCTRRWRGQTTLRRASDGSWRWKASIHRFTRSYEQHRPRLFVLMDDVQHAWHTAARAVEAPLLDRWWRLLATIDEQAAAVLRRGQPISMPPSGVDPRAGPHERSG